VLAVAVVADDSRRTDRAVMHGEDTPTTGSWTSTAVPRHDAGASGYTDAPPATGTFTTDEPFPVRLDLDILV
jgi:hypothetical protein